MKLLSKFFKSVDLFSKRVDLYLAHKDGFSTWPGALLSWLIVFVTVLYASQRYTIMVEFGDTVLQKSTSYGALNETEDFHNFTETLNAYTIGNLKLGHLDHKEYERYVTWHSGIYWWSFNEETKLYEGGVDVAPMKLCTQ